VHAVPRGDLPDEHVPVRGLHRLVRRGKVLQRGRPELCRVWRGVLCEGRSGKLHLLFPRVLFRGHGGGGVRGLRGGVGGALVRCHGLHTLRSR